MRCERILSAFFASIDLINCAAFKKPKVVVIGCGVSGLELSKNTREIACVLISLVKHLVESDKFQVIGLEARDRVGGRVFTNEKGHETGAAWIHGTQIVHPDGAVEENPVLTMAKEFIPPSELFLNSNFMAVHSDGSDLPCDTDIWDGMWTVLNQIKTSEEAISNAYHPSTVSIYDFISTNWIRLFSQVRGHSEKAIVKSVIEWQSYYATNWETTSIGSMAVDKEFDGDQLLIMNGGYTRLLNRYLDHHDLRPFIHLNTPVTKIERDSQGCRIFTVNDSVFEADVVVVTVPLGVLKHNGIIFDPPLPQQKQDSINRLGYGLYDKVFVDFAGPIETEHGGFWQSGIDVIFIVPKAEDDYHEYLRTTAVDDNNNYQFNNNNNNNVKRRPYDQRDEGHIGIEMANLSPICHCPKIAMLIYDKAARDMEAIAHDPQLLIEFARSKLQNAFPSSHIPEIVNVEATRWGMDPYAYGSYANIPLGASGQDMINLSLPVDDKILFAGEASCPLHYSTVHGAMKSGRREFARLMQMFYSQDENQYQNLL